MPSTDTATLIVSCKTQGQANLDKVNRSLTGMDGFAKRAIGTFAGFFAGSKIYQFGKQAVGAFQETQDAAWQFSQTFANLQGTAEKVYKEFSTTYGLSEKSARSMLSMTGDLLKGAGFSEASALKLSEATAKMATDIAGYKNYAGGAEGATMALTKAMLGEAESMKTLGVVINQNSDQYKKFFEAFKGGGMTIEQVREAMGKFSSSDAKVTAQWEHMIKLLSSGKNLSEQEAKALTALALTLKQTKQMVGDWIKEGESFSQTMLNQKELTKDLMSELGKVIYNSTGLNDVMTSANQKLKSLIDYLKKEGPIISHAVSNVIATLVGSFRKAALFLEPLFNLWLENWKYQIKMIGWFGENFFKIFENIGSIGKAAALDILEQFLFVPRQIINAWKGVGSAILEALKTGNISAAFSKSFDDVIRNARSDFNKLGGNTRAAFAKAGISALPEMGKIDTRAWTDGQYRAQRLADIDKEVAKMREKADKRLFESLTQGKNLKDNKKGQQTQVSSVNNSLAQFSQALTRARDTAINAVASNSTSAAQMQSRMLLGLAGGGAMTQNTLAQRTATSSQQTAANTQRIVDSLGKILTKVSSIGTSKIG